MRTWIIGSLAALALAACGSKSTCEKLMRRAMECSPELQHAPDDKRELAQSIADGMIDKACGEDEVQKAANKLSDCLDADSCDAFNSCVRKTAGGGFEF